MMTGVDIVALIVCVVIVVAMLRLIFRMEW